MPILYDNASFQQFHCIEMPRVLISGAGIAGTVLAYWLGKNGFDVVVLDRVSSPKNPSGQIIDIAGPAQVIVQRMGMLESIQSKVTHEAGIRFVDESGREFARLPVGHTGVSNEIEILRPLLAEILLGASDALSNVQFRFGCSIRSIRQSGSHVTVSIQEGAQVVETEEEYSFLVACDGLRSSTRDLILPESERRSCVKSINAFAAFFSIPAEPRDRPYATLFSAPGRRAVFTKPLSEQETSAYLTWCNTNQEFRDARASRDITLQKQVVADHFKNLGWETDRLIRGMMETNNFYFEEISQVMLTKWSKGRCVLLGDTAYCPSPLTGQGTNLAILGAYVLASKLTDMKEDPVKAFEHYEKDLRPYVNRVQPIPLRGFLPLLLNPESNWGIWINRTIISWVSWLQPWRYVPNTKNEFYDLPNL